MSEQRSNWLTVIELILSEADKPMSAEEIARAALARQLIRANALLPEESVRSAIRQHVKEQGNELGFTKAVLNKTYYFSMRKKPLQSLLRWQTTP